MSALPPPEVLRFLRDQIADAWVRNKTKAEHDVIGFGAVLGIIAERAAQDMFLTSRPNFVGQNYKHKDLPPRWMRFA